MEGVVYKEPAWVCWDCAKSRGASPPQGHVYTVHPDICGLCMQKKAVTEPRDYGATRGLLCYELEDRLEAIHSWKRRITSDKLEVWIDFTALYSKTHWLILIEEKLHRIEKEIYI